MDKKDNTQNQDTIEIGKIVNTHALRGEVKIQPWCDDPTVFDVLPLLIIDGKEYEIERNRLHKNCQIVKLDGVDSIEEAEKMRNKTVSVYRCDVPKDENKYFVADIIGLLVKDENGNKIGIVEDVIKTGSNDVYVLKDTFISKPVLLPVIDSVILDTDIENGFIVASIPKGLID